MSNPSKKRGTAWESAVVQFLLEELARIARERLTAAGVPEDLRDAILNAPTSEEVIRDIRYPVPPVRTDTPDGTWKPGWWRAEQDVLDHLADLTARHGDPWTAALSMFGGDS